MRISERTAWRLLVAVALAWYAVVFLLYAKLQLQLPLANLPRFFDDAKDYFLWQGGALLVMTTLVSLVRPALTGRVTAVCLLFSTTALLMFSRELSKPILFVAFSTWCVLATNSVRLAIRRFVGASQGTWGIAAGVLYGALIPVSFFLALFDFLTRWTVGILAVLALVPGAVDFLRRKRRCTASSSRFLSSMNAIGAAALAVIWILLALSFVWASTPETESDSARVHLPYIRQLVENQGFQYNYIDLFRLMPKAVQTTFAAAFTLASFYASKWLSWFALVALTILIAGEVARRSGDTNLGLLSGAIALAAPIPLRLAATLYIDHVVALLCVAAFVALFHALRDNSKRGVLLSAFIIGCTAQTKYNALLFVLVWALFLALYEIRRTGWSVGVRSCMLAFLLITVVASPWYLYTYALTGNPLYPWLDHIFDSPYWPDGMPPFGLEDIFKLSDSPIFRLFFPWPITFTTSTMIEDSDGALGFQLLALSPFVLALVWRRCRACSDLGIAGLLIFWSVALYVPYVRYWLPGYYLMLMSLSLLLGKSVEFAGWRVKHVTASLAGIVVFVAFLSHLPVFGGTWRAWPWSAYSREMSERGWLAERFYSYPAIEELNRFVPRDARVLTSGYSAVHTVDADAYDFPFWYTGVYQINTAAALDKFFHDNGVDYWVVDHSLPDARYFEAQFEASSRYWTDSRLISAAATTAVYEVLAEPVDPRLELIYSHEIEPLLLAGTEGEITASAGWRDLYTESPKLASQATGETVRISSRGNIFHTFPAPASVDLCRSRVEISVASKSHVVMVFEWLDSDQQLIAQVAGSSTLDAGGGEARVFGVPPAGTVYVRLRLWPWKSDALELTDAFVDCFRSLDGA